MWVLHRNTDYKYNELQTNSVNIPKEVVEYVIWSTHWRLPDSPTELDKINENLEISRNFGLKSYNWIRQWHLFFLQRWDWSISGGSTCSSRNMITLLNDGIKQCLLHNYKHTVRVVCSIHSLLYRYQKRSFNIWYTCIFTELCIHSTCYFIVTCQDYKYVHTFLRYIWTMCPKFAKIKLISFYSILILHQSVNWSLLEMEVWWLLEEPTFLH